MDNITHSTIGAAVGEVAYRLSRRIPEHKRDNLPSRAWFWGTSLFANNFPDLDILYCHLGGPELGYLLHHRGHTHTFVGMFPQLLLILWILFIVAKIRKKHFSTIGWSLLGMVSMLGMGIHVGLDFLNIYGVHPLWPFNNQWFYGDILFIVEPTFWLVLFPWLYSSTQRKSLRAFFVAGSIGTLALVWFSGWIPFLVASTISVLHLGFWALILFNRNQMLSWATGPAFVGIFVTFAWTSSYNRTEIEQNFHASKNDSELVDIALSPLPSNPFCYTFLVTEKTAAGVLKIQRGMWATNPKVLSTEQCPALFTQTDSVTDPLTDDRAETFREYKTYLSFLQELERNSAKARAFFQFTRSPFAKEQGTNLIVADARFDRAGSSWAQIVFTELELQKAKRGLAAWTQKKWIPTWEYPRTDVLK